MVLDDTGLEGTDGVMTDLEEFNIAPFPRVSVDGYTIEWRSNQFSVQPVVECNVWSEELGDSEEGVRERRVVLLQGDYDAIFRIHREMYSGNQEVGELVLAASYQQRRIGGTESVLQPVLGWDFKRDLPVLLMYPLRPKMGFYQEG